MIPGNDKKCQKISVKAKYKNVRKCQKMSENARKCQKVSMAITLYKFRKILMGP